MPHKDHKKAKEYWCQYYLEHAEKKKEQAIRRYHACKPTARSRALALKRSKKWAKENPERIREIFRKHEYGISPEEYRLRLRNQKSLCAICGKKETQTDHRSGKTRTLSVDHDHKTNKIRGLLCGNCNRGLGLFQDDLSLLLKAIKYLKVSNGK